MAQGYLRVIGFLLLRICKATLLNQEKEEQVPLAQIKETEFGTIVAEYEWTISNVRHVLQLTGSPYGDIISGPSFYTGRPGYKIQLSLSAGRIDPSNGQAYVGAWFFLLPGLFDDALEWPFQYTLNLTLVARKDDPSQSLHLTMNPATAICRLRKQFLKPLQEDLPNEDGCGESFFVSHARLLEMEDTFLSRDELLLRATIFLQGGGSSMPRRAKVLMRGHRLVSEFLWRVDDIHSKRSLGQITSDHFYVNSESYLMVLHLSFHNDDVGLFATVVPGDFDDSLHWPFAYQFELSIVDFSAFSNDRKGSVDPTSGSCPLSAFTKPRHQPNVPCGFRKLAKFSMLKTKNLMRNDSILIKFTAILDQMPHFAKLTLKENFLVAEYKWRIPSIERKIQQAKLGRVSNLLSERFYSSDQGYLMQLQMKFQNKTDGHVGIFLTLLEGEYDPLLEWPFMKRFALSVVDQQELGQDLDIHVDPTDSYIRSEACSGSFWRPFGRNDACGSSNAIGYEQLYDRKFIRFGAILLRALIFLDEFKLPRFATLTVMDHHLVAHHEWIIPDIEEKIRQSTEGRLSHLDSEKFYLSNNGYRMMLRLYPEKTPGYVGLYAVLTKGAHDNELRWPFEHPYRLEIIGERGSISRTTHPGAPSSGCPDIAFQKPSRELAEWSCGEGHMVTHETLLRQQYTEANGSVRVAVTVFLQDLNPPVASLGFERGFLTARYSWILKHASVSLDLLQAGEMKRLEGPVFYSENQGYAMSLSLSLEQWPNHENSSDAESMFTVGLYWTLHSGLYDDIVQWPFRSRLVLSIVGDRLLEKIIDPALSKCPEGAFEKPREAQSEHSCGFASLLTLNSLMKDYVNNDKIHFKTSIFLN